MSGKKSPSKPIKGTKQSEKHMSSDFDLSKDIMKSIKSDDVSMRSHNYFLGLTVLFGLLTVLVVTLGAIMLNVFVYDIQTGRDLGLSELYVSQQPAFPWALLFITIALTGLIYKLAKHFEFGYKHRMYAVGSIVVGSVLAVSLIISVTGRSGDFANLSPFRSVAPHSKFVQDRVVVGEVLEHNETLRSILMAEVRGVEITINYQANTPVKGGHVLTGVTIMAIGDPLSTEAFAVEAIIVNPPSPRLKGLHGRHRNFEIFVNDRVY